MIEQVNKEIQMFESGVANMSELFRKNNTIEDYQRAGIRLEIANIDISD